MRQSETRADADPPTETPGHGDQWQTQETTTMTMSITIHGIDEAEFQEVLRAVSAAAGANEVTSFDDTPMPTALLEELWSENDHNHWSIRDHAERLFNAAMAREPLDSTTPEMKATALACFWAATCFANVSVALAHTYGDDPLPVGKTFDEFITGFLTPEGLAGLEAVMKR